MYNNLHFPIFYLKRQKLQEPILTSCYIVAFSPAVHSQGCHEEVLGFPGKKVKILKIRTVYIIQLTRVVAIRKQ